MLLYICLQDQLNRNKVPEWQRIAGKAAKEVEKFAKEKTDLVLMHWRDKMGIAQKEVSIYRDFSCYLFSGFCCCCFCCTATSCGSSCWCCTVLQT